MVRRLKAQVLPQLPQKQFHLVPLAITTDMRAALRHPGWARVSQLIEMEAEDFASGIGVDGAVSTVMRLLGEAKVGPACDYIEELLAEGIEKLVIAAHHTSVLKVARERLAKYGLEYMDGGTPLRHRQAGVLEFQTNPKVRIILGQTQVIGEGFTLTAAQDIVLLEPEWVPGRIEQVVDRIHRIGQTGAYVQAHLPVVPGSLDETMVATAVAKSKDIHSALDAIA
jgi:SNF2 family DNA or RNA helicase